MRVKITKSKNATSLYIIKDIHQNNKRTTTIVKKLGTLDHLIATLNLSEDEVLAWANDQAKQLALMEKQKYQEISLTFSTTPLPPTNHTRNCGYLYLKSVYYQLGLSDITTKLKDKAGIACDLNAIVEMLVYARIMVPGSSGSSINWAKNLLEPFDFTHQEIWRSINALEVHNDYLQELLVPCLAGKSMKDSAVIYYDWTDFFLDPPKSGPYLDPIALDVFCSGSGIPLSSGINHHHTPQQAKIVARQFPQASLIVCSDTNLNGSTHHEFHRFKSLFARRSHLIIQPLADQPQAIQDWALNGTDWHLPGNEEDIDISHLDESNELEHIYYKEWAIEENGIKQRLIAGFSLKYRNFMMKRMAESSKSTQMEPQSDHRAKESHWVSDDSNYPGFFVAKATGSEDIATLLEIICRRFDIEQLAHQLKIGFRSPAGTHQGHPQSYSSSRLMLKAHLMVCLLALAIECELERDLGIVESGNNWKKTLRSLNVVKLKDLGYLPNFEANAMSDKFHQLGWLDLYKEIISPNQMKAMIESITKSARRM